MTVQQLFRGRQSADAPARLRGIQNAEQSRSDASDASSDGTSVLFPPFLTSSGNLRIPSSLPYFPARERGEASEPEVRNSDSDDDREGEGDSPTVILGMRMLEAARQTTIQPSQNYAPDETTDSRTSALCIPPPAPLPAPTHLLELKFTACGETLLVPIHQGLWANKSRFLSHLDANASPAPADLRDGQLRIISLPIIRHTLPFRTVWPVLYQYLHVGSTAAVLQDLLTFPVPPSPLSSDPADVQQHQLGAVVARIERIRRLWLDVVALEADTDIELWDAMDRAWNVLLAELKDGLHESPPREGPSPTEGDQRTT
ncbi:hypothetical protein NBRC10513_002203 [Rhodotorula toruloides]